MYSRSLPIIGFSIVLYFSTPNTVLQIVLPRQRPGRRAPALPRAPDPTPHPLANKTRRIPKLDAHGKEAVNFQISIGTLQRHRRHPSERRQILPLPDNDPVHSITNARSVGRRVR